MENDQVLEADAALARPRNRSRRSADNLTEGHDEVNLIGGIEFDRKPTEQTPLLEQHNSSGRSSSHSTASQPDDEPDAAAWDGMREYKDAHWTRKPSVRPLQRKVPCGMNE